jgi:hypothetical protein
VLQKSITAFFRKAKKKKNTQKWIFLCEPQPKNGNFFILSHLAAYIAGEFCVTDFYNFTPTD